MDRRSFIATSAAATSSTILSKTSIGNALTRAQTATSSSLDLTRHRFGVNYTPSHNWWFCWNDWDPDPIRRDLDAIAALGDMNAAKRRQRAADQQPHRFLIIDHENSQILGFLGHCRCSRV